MARKVKCQITGEYGTSDLFYKAPNGKYYKSKALFDKWMEEKLDRERAIEKFATDFLDYRPGQIFPTLLVKRFKELEFYGYDVINRTIDKCYKNIMYAIETKNFSNDQGKIAYIFAIIKNNINDVYKEVLKEEKSLTKESYVPDQTISVDDIQTTHKEKNISRFLEEADDWL